MLLSGSGTLGFCTVIVQALAKFLKGLQAKCSSRLSFHTGDDIGQSFRMSLPGFFELTKSKCILALPGLGIGREVLRDIFFWQTSHASRQSYCGQTGGQSAHRTYGAGAANGGG